MLSVLQPLLTLTDTRDVKKIYFVFAALLAVACTQSVVTVIPEPVSMTVATPGQP